MAMDTSSPGQQDGAPRYVIPACDLAAVEVPAIVDNPDRAVRAFGRVSDLQHVSTDDQG